MGKLYIKSLPDGEPKRVTRDETYFELYPSFSPDGKWIVYATWSDEELGSIRKVPVGGGASIPVTSRKGHYIEPSFSPDGKKIVFRKISGDHLRGSTYSRQTGIHWIPAAGGETTLITEEGYSPRFTKEGDRIFLHCGEGGKRAPISIGLKGEQRRVHLLSENATQIIPSPDEQWALSASGWLAIILRSLRLRC